MVLWPTNCRNLWRLQCVYRQSGWQSSKHGNRILHCEPHDAFLHISPFDVQPAPKLWSRSLASWQSAWERPAASWKRSCLKAWTTAWPSWTTTLKATCHNPWPCWKPFCRSATTPSLPASTPSTQLQHCSGPASATCSTAWTRYGKKGRKKANYIFDFLRNFCYNNIFFLNTRLKDLCELSHIISR